jgi:hypothetical protein
LNIAETLPGASFTVNGAAPPANSALTTAAAELHMTANWSPEWVTPLSSGA